MSIALWHAASRPVGGDGLPVCHQICRVKPIRDENGLAVDFEIDGEYPQYGNNDERVDSIACDLVERFMKKIKALPTYRNAVPPVDSDYHF